MGAVPYSHDWHTIDEEHNIQCRVNSDGTVDLGTPDDHTVYTWEEFNKWRGGKDGES